jgi:hypothetical protein
MGMPDGVRFSLELMRRNEMWDVGRGRTLRSDFAEKMALDGSA